ncbi:hypothetical protein DOTSEDRAFT_71504 [Lecanosticta acicola]|uniref:Solute carrier family 40 member n=1 Tax=Lecanosticta acicola TaxID=111012 RepID=A0AAI8Z7A9_9PEZI|nr:hypothetical protein DOTSEDRAFT_71504 [Lecanosticta acicola]
MDGYRTFGPGSEDEDATETGSLRDRNPREDSIEARRRRNIDHASLIAFYAGHALFMANNRGYEFASVLFTASAFPHTLVAASLRGLSAHLASVLFSPSVGRWCDAHASRIRPVQICIVMQRFCIALACLGWALIVQESEACLDPGFRGQPDVSTWKRTTFAVLLLLGMLERLSAVGNQIVVERDWLPLLAERNWLPRLAERSSPSGTAPDSPSPKPLLHTTTEEDPLLSGKPPRLHNLNATTKLIDLVTKLVTPLAVSAIAIGFTSTRWVAGILALTQLLSCPLELYLTHLVWTACPALQKPKAGSQITSATSPEEDQQVATLSQRFKTDLTAWSHSLRIYIRSTALLPSLAFALEPFSVLTLAGSMTSYLLVAQFPLTHITAARAASTIVEISSTILTPLLIAWHSRRNKDPPEDPSNLRSLTFVGLLGLSWQFILLIPATTLLMLLGNTSSTGFPSAAAAKFPAILFTTLALSRLGPFAYSLVSQQIVQLQVPSHERMQFSGVEMALIDLSELARWGMLGIFGAPSQFRWAAVISFCSVGLSVGMFAVWKEKKK